MEDTKAAAVSQPSPALQSVPVSECMLPQWYALYTAPCHEKRVAEHLRYREVEAYLPLYRTVHRWRNRCVRQLELPLFSNYLFVRLPWGQRGRALAVPGVRWMVGSERMPSPLPDFEIESLRAGLDGHNCEPCPYLVAGERVRIRSGALAGMEGVLVRRKSGLRVVLSLDLIRQSVSVEADAADLEPAGLAWHSLRGVA
jgi:transcription antitermination factor NusG